MFTIILKSSEFREVARASLKGNDSFLIQNHEFKILFELSECDIDVFDSSDMDMLIVELNKLKRSLIKIEHINHVEKILNLASKCKVLKGSVLVFTPFEPIK